MRVSWDEESALALLKKWIDKGEWKGTLHFRKHNSSLYEYLYRTMGMDTAFKKLHLDYSDFKKSKGSRKRKKNEEVIKELNTLITSGKWKGIRHLQENNNHLYRELSRMGFAKAFRKLGLDYKNYRNASWDQEEILHELKQIIDNKEWKGSYHLKIHNNRLYNAIYRNFGFPQAFCEIGLNYDDYRKDRKNNKKTEE